MRKTKIIATLGPASFNLDTISQLINNGMDVARINMSHYNENAGLEKYIQCIREQAEKYKRTVAILFDLCGPKIRVKKLKCHSIQIKKGSNYTLGSRECDIPINMDLSFTGHSLGGVVKVNDGNLSFEILNIENDYLNLRYNLHLSQTNKKHLIQ